MKKHLWFACILLVSTSLAFGYGNSGHETVGKLAAHYLAGTRAEVEVTKLLNPTEDLAKAATWADRAKLPEKYLSNEMKDFVANNPRHHSYHYCDIPFQEKAYRLGVTGTNSEDIVQMMKRCIAILENSLPIEENPTKITKRVALLLLAHYVGDLHQPLHVGCSYVDNQDRFVNPETGAKGQQDAGANNFKLTATTSLHGYWDTAAVKIARAKAPGADFADYLLKTYPPENSWKVDGKVAIWPEKWATDTLSFSAQCFQGIKLSERRTVPADEKYPAHDEWTVTLDADYGEKAASIVSPEIAKAGWRLAELLKAIWPTASTQ